MKWLLMVLGLLALAVAPAGAQQDRPAVYLNEIYARHDGTDNREFIELSGVGSLGGLAVLIVDGEGGVAGILDHVWPLDGYTMPDDPNDHYFVLGDTGVANNDYPIGTQDMIENGTETFYLVWTRRMDDLLDLQGQDIDSDNDGLIFTDPDEPFNQGGMLVTIWDKVGMRDNDAGDIIYDITNTPVLGPHGVYYPADYPSGFPAGIYRTWDAPNGWCRWTFLDYNPNGTGTCPPRPTPGWANSYCHETGATNGAKLIQKGATGVVINLQEQVQDDHPPFIYVLVDGPIPQDGVGRLYDNNGSITTYPHEVVGPLKYDSPGPNFLSPPDQPRFDFYVIDACSTQSPTVAYCICVQDNTVVITEIMHFPNGWDDVQEYLEVYNYGASAVTLWGLAGDLINHRIPPDPPDPEVSGNLQGRTIPAGTMKIIAPSNSTAQNEEFRCEWPLNEADIIRVDSGTWENIQVASSLVALYGDEGGVHYLLDAVWIRENGPGWAIKQFEHTRSMVMWNSAGPPTSANNDGDSVDAVNWRLSCLPGESDPPEACNTSCCETFCTRVSETLGNKGSPGCVPTYQGSYTPPPSCYGACCLPDGSCEKLTQAGCAAGWPPECPANEWYQATSCQAGLCTPDPASVCCHPFLPEGCMILPECTCLRYGGQWEETQTSCPGTCPPGYGEVLINEIRIDQPSYDDDEYFELYGPPGVPLGSLSYIVIGDYAADNGIIEEVIDLTGYSIPADGFFLGVEEDFDLVPPTQVDLRRTLNFENDDNVTHLLVYGFTGSDGDDLDTDDDCILESEPWQLVLDSIALLRSEPDPEHGSDCVYGENHIGPWAQYHVRRCPDGHGWTLGEYDPLAGMDSPGSSYHPPCDCNHNGTPDEQDILQGTSQDCNTNAVPDECDVGSGVSHDANANGTPDECEWDVEIALVVRRFQSGIDTSTTLPTSDTWSIESGQFVVELWATDSGFTNTGLIGVYVNLVFPPDVAEALSIDHRPPFMLLPEGGIDNVAGIIACLGGTDQTLTGQGIAPQWVRVAVVQFEAQCRLVPAQDLVVSTQASPCEISAYGRGAIPPEQTVFGTAFLDILDCVYDLTGDCCIDAGDLGMFAPCWLCCEGEPCWAPNTCEEKDFDCSGCVAAGDLGWFAPAWLKCCRDLDPDDLPPCRRPARSAEDSTGPVPFPSDERVLIRWRTSPPVRFEQAPAELLPAGLAAYWAGDPIAVDLWVRDQTAASRGLTAAFVDMAFDPVQVRVDAVEHSSTYGLFAGGALAGPEIAGLGGATLQPGVAVGSWTHFARVRMTALVDLPRGPQLNVRPSLDGVAGFGRGTVPPEHIRVLGPRDVSISHD